MWEFDGEVVPQVRATEQFGSLCPSTATVMRRTITAG